MPRIKDPVTGKYTKMPLPQLQEGGNPTALPSDKSEESENKSEVEITFTKDPKEAGEKKAADKTVNEFVEGLKKFTKSLKESKFGKAAMAAGSAIASGAKSAAGVIQQRANEAGFSKEQIAQDIGMDSPLLQAAAGLTLDAGGALLKGGGKMLGWGKKKLFGSKESGEEEGSLEKVTGEGEEEGSLEKVTGEGEGEGVSESGSGLLEKLSEIQVSVSNIEKYMEDSQQDADRARMEGIEASRESLDPSDDTVSQVEKKKSGGGGGMLAGLLGGGGILGGLFSGSGGGMMKIVKTLFGSIGKIFSGLMNLATKIPALVSKAMPFLKQGAKFFKQIFKRLFWPVTALIALFNFVDGFIAGYKEGGIIEGFKQGMESLLENLIDVPLNMLKDGVAWIMGALGFENIEKALNSFEFDFSSLWGDAFQAIVDFLTDIPDMMMSLFIKIAKPVQDLVNKIPGMNVSFVDDMQADLDQRKAEKKEARAERDKRTEERRNAGKEAEASGVEPTDSQTSSGAESGLERQSGQSATSESYEEFMKKRSSPDGKYLDKDTGLRFRSSNSLRAAKRAWEMKQQASMIEARGGTTGAFIGDNLVEVDGRSIDPVPLQRDSRGIAASRIQDAAMAASGGGGSAPIVSVTTTDNSQKKGGTTVVPGILNTETDPFMSQISNADF